MRLSLLSSKTTTFRKYANVLLVVLLSSWSWSSSLSSPSSYSSPFGLVTVASAWEWTDYIVGGGSAKIGKDDDDDDGINIAGEAKRRRTYLTDDEISELRVRDLKRRLSRNHGFGAEELGRMLDKKDLISALIKEETKLRNKQRNDQLRKYFWKALFVAILCVVTVVGWPIWTQASEVMAVNWTVWYDRKRHEITQCWELKSVRGLIGVIFLGLLDLIRLWLSITVLASWVLSNGSQYRKYLFPMPSIAIRPGQFMGEKVAKSSMGQYGMNIAPMAITWAIGFVRTKLEYWTGKALSADARIRRKESRSGETEEERKARKVVRKAAKRAAREERERQQQEVWEKETARRKEMADKASEQLFGGGHDSGQVKQPNNNEERETFATNNDEQKESATSNVDYDDFLDNLEDMNDLD